jgi:hypothetical protein
MNTGTRLAAFGVVLAAALGGGAAVGAVLGPSAAVEVEAPPPLGQGVVAAEDGYRLVPSTTQLAVGGSTFQFRILKQDATSVRNFTPTHERDLHLIVVNRELTEFHHVHPVLATDGTWSVDLPSLPAGAYRAVADFWITDGPHLALGTDLNVDGDHRATQAPEPSETAKVDGYTVTLTTEHRKGGMVVATLLVAKDGQVVTDLEPYLGARGHLVALRAGDLAYAHVHPQDDDASGEVVTFDATLDSAGRYRLFFDFQHRGVVHTAAFTFDQSAVYGAPAMEH